MKPPRTGRRLSPEQPAPGKPGRRERRRAETREKIFRAALALFATRGFQDTTVEDITEAADVGKGTFFNYFPSKEHVLATFGEMQRGKLESAIAAARDDRTPVRKVLKELMPVMSEEPGRSPTLLRSIFFAMLSNGAVCGMVTKNIDLGRQRLEELLAIGQQRGEIRRDRPADELSRVLQRSSFGTLLFWSLQPEAPLAGQLISNLELFWSGIAAGPASSRGKRR